MTDTTYRRADLSIDPSASSATDEVVRVADVGPIRDELERRVRQLLDELHVPA